MKDKLIIYNNKLFLAGISFSILFCIIGIVFPNKLIHFMSFWNAFILDKFSFFYLLFGLLIVLFALSLVFLPFSKKKLGDTKPEYSYFSWIALLYSTGMGSGLLLRAVQEPMYYLKNPPVTVYDSKQTALQYTFFHWGFTPWAMYSLFGLIVAYNLYIKKEKNFLTAIVVNVGNSKIKKIIPLFIIMITIAGVIASLGLGTSQFIGGMNQYFNLDLGYKSLLITVSIIGITGTLSALTGISKVIRYLADFDVTVSLLLLVFVAYFLNFQEYFYTTILALYHYVIHFFEMSLSVGNFKTLEQFNKDWTVFYWAFWLAWVPFTGIFIARISKGRTIREFIFATIFVPAIATMIWFSVFANSAFEIIKNSDSSQFDNVFTSLFVFLGHYPLSIITVFLAAVLVLVSIINSVDSAIFVLGMFSDSGKEDPSKKHKLFWGIIITTTAIGLTAAGSNDLLNAISNLLIILALPFSLLYLYIIISFANQLIKKRRK
ncbi:BCCT family transporter [Flavobacterium plurextorum]|uniref:BCCT family transporter n=1 Tax=Flavobacterium TaxID=237 RepID=UPI00214D1D8E|nr:MULTISPECIES: BCCT family transporter [Flavobacterium]UUW08758.1 BCCT family transporter [Flavobacterium plurextorum]